jgi:ribonucleoside-diphosphate reductase alpha chain
MQAAFQRHCDAAVSKTINFSENAGVAAVDKAYKLAYRLGCKGITIYRRRSRVREPMSLY